MFENIPFIHPLKSVFHGKLLKETMWSFATKGVVFLLFIVLNIILVRSLGPHQFGLFSFFLSIFTIVELISFFGINKSARKYAAQYNRSAELPNVLRASLKLRFVVSLLSVVLFYLFRGILADAAGRPELNGLFLIAIPLLFVSGFLAYLNEFFQGLHKLKYNLYLTILENSLKIMLAVYLIKSFGIQGVIVAFTVACTLTTLAGFFFLYTRFYKNADDDPRISLTGQMFRYSIPFFVTSIGFVVSTELNTVMLGILTSDVEVAVFAVAKQPVEKFSHVAFAIALGVMPVFAKFNAERKDLKVLFYRLLKLNALVYSAIGLAIISSAWFLIPFLYGQEYAQAVIPALLLLPYLVQVSYSVFLSFFLDYQGKASKRAVNLIVSVFANIVLNLILIPKYGPSGASIATSVSYFPYVLLNWLEVRNELQKVV